MAPTKPTNCFVAGTPVWCIDGLAPIESIQPGMRVFGYDMKSKQFVGCDVLKTDDQRVDDRKKTDEQNDQHRRPHHPVLEPSRDERVCLRACHRPPRTIPITEQCLAAPPAGVDAAPAGSNVTVHIAIPIKTA